MDHTIPARTFLSGTLILPTRLISDGLVGMADGRLTDVGPAEEVLSRYGGSLPGPILGSSAYLAPGYIDLHVHGGAGADFMDGDADAFAVALAAHARHGTTRIAPTTTVASQACLLRMLDRCHQFRRSPLAAGARVLGAHFYGPYFGKEAAGCHPKETLRDPDPTEYEVYLRRHEDLVSATVAPELPGAETFVKACRDRGLLVTVGHSHATFDQVRQAVAWGARHVDHLFCAMSDRARLRQSQTYPMRGGVLEATLFFDELTTEVIADGKHLTPELLQLALKIKGPERLALVTDCNRALDLPDGEYLFGALDEGEKFIRKDDVGLMPDGKALASSVMGMDHMVRTFLALTGAGLPTVVRMASLTPATILGQQADLGSLTPGKRADVLLLNQQLHVDQVYIDGVSAWRRDHSG